jgi:hypothetical protein
MVRPRRTELQGVCHGSHDRSYAHYARICALILENFWLLAVLGGSGRVQSGTNFPEL